MSIKETLAQWLIAYCVELGQVKFDEETNRRKMITADSQVVEWKVPDYQKEDAIEYLKLHFPDVEDSLIEDAINEHLI